jgi:hydroxyethylthiazole kinase
MSKQLLEEAARIVDAVREQNPLVDCITNVVTVNDCANILLAAGASPAMCDVFDESYEFSRLAGALYINLGTYVKEQECAAIEALLGAKRAGIPVVIDPVGCAAMPKRVKIVEHFFNIAGFDVIKGNMGEIMALAGERAEAKGVDSSGEAAGIEEAARNLAKRYACVVAATGKADVITDGERALRVHNGSEMLTKITGAGCMAGALCAATAASAHKSGAGMLEGALSGILAMGIAGENAALKTKLPGSFRVALVDCVWSLNGADILKAGKVQC